MSSDIKLVGRSLKKYWTSMLQRRMPEHDEINRLITIMKGFYFSQIKNEFENDPEAFKFDKFSSINEFIDFHDSKRPYGSKDVEASIAYNLGWDYKRQLCFYPMPEEILIVCEDLHKKVLATLQGINSFIYF